MSLPEELLRPKAFARVAFTTTVALVETHISWVFLLDHDVFKVKKPIDLGFLDFRHLDQRRRACEDEVRLNARLAPDVYRGIAPIRCGRDGRWVVGGDGELVDWAVHMARLSDKHRADVLLGAGVLGGDDIDRIATRVAAFHAAASTDATIAAFGSVDVVARNVEENFDQTRETITEYVTKAEADEIVRWQRAFLHDRGTLFAERIARGRVRDGHGDLRLEHVYLAPSGIRIIDCIEFSDRFRYGDVCADVAFLAMDLAAHGRVDLSERLLATYARDADDYDLYSVVDFYGSYRAFVRGKIASIVAHDERASSDVRRRAAEQARKFFRLALCFERPSLVRPTVVAVGGVIASGKSSIASGLGTALSAPVLDADRTRKALLGVPPLQPIDEPPWSGAYSTETSKFVYDELLRRAAVVLSSGRAVVLDASFRSEDLRRRARDVALAHGVPFRFVECTAPRDVCLARLAERSRGLSVSDGRRAIFDAFCDRYESSRSISPGERIALDTTHPVEESLRTLQARLAVWPEGLTG